MSKVLSENLNRGQALEVLSTCASIAASTSCLISDVDKDETMEIAKKIPFIADEQIGLSRTAWKKQLLGCLKKAAEMLEEDLGESK